MLTTKTTAIMLAMVASSIAAPGAAAFGQSATDVKSPAD
jgi:hypothetical protein